ncbi:hypothetical protein [Candidatus Aalborgicola defluviihabitans]|nr:hypothetical protein [Burkholderiales bacterium]MBK6570754.1 hypothetical protein [Burkholderiales bacterium]MBK7279749.1 hypothetical protein [Burkholderiales bacterium]MBK7312563.1 hypothetical protein [Burkholderiales bacterium]MBL0243375.1 hypothetical protein [Rhodoferax sp.]
MNRVDTRPDDLTAGVDPAGTTYFEEVLCKPEFLEVEVKACGCTPHQV